MTTYNGRKLNRQRARRARWERAQPWVLLVLVALIVASLWYLSLLAGVV